MAKRNITAENGAEIDGPDPLKKSERQYGQAMEEMVDLMARIFKSQAVQELNKSTVEKFADAKPVLAPEDVALLNQHKFTDAQVGNFASVFLGLARKVTRKLQKRFSFERLERLARSNLDEVNQRGREQFYKRVENTVGINANRLAQEEGLKPKTNALMLETAQWSKKLRDQVLEEFTSNALRIMAEGGTLEDVLSGLDEIQEKRKGQARMIARTQVSTFNSIMTKTRAQNLGITKAVWKTAADERVRRCHQARNGKEFDLDKGLYSSCDGKWLLPGVDYNCFPGWSKLNHASLCDKLYRRRYAGELAEIVTDDGVVLHATPNHPILTVNGFKPAGLLNGSDYVVRAVDQGFDTVELYGKDVIPKFEKIGRSLDLLGVEGVVAPAVSGKFHGDVSDSDVEVVSFDSLLMREGNASVREKLAKLDLSLADKMVVLEAFTSFGAGLSGFRSMPMEPDSIVRALDLAASLILCHLTPLERFCFALGSWADPGLLKAFSDNIARDAEVLGDSVFAFSVLVHGDDLINRKVAACRSFPSGWGLNANLRKLSAEGGGMNPDLLTSFNKGSSIAYKVSRVVDNGRVDFSGHIYNLETVSHDYIVDTAAVSNCRCTYRMVVPENEEE